MVKFLYHGTSTLYRSYLETDGLTGRYPDYLYEKLKKFYIIATGSRTETSPYQTHHGNYIQLFFLRQKDVRTDELNIDISLSADYSNAEEYANRGRKNGEGPGYIIGLLKEKYDTILSTDVNLKQELDELIDFFDQKTAGIVLAFDKSELKEYVQNVYGEDAAQLVSEQIDSRSVYKRFTYPIPAHLIYVMNNKTHAVKLLSKDGKEFIDSLIQPESSETLPESGSSEDILDILLDKEIKVNLNQIIRFKLIPFKKDHEWEVHTSDISSYRDYYFYTMNLGNGDYMLKIKRVLKLQKGGKFKNKRKTRKSKRIRTRRRRNMIRV